jgi:hypothetical protein
MSIATLLYFNPEDPLQQRTFAFENLMAHRYIFEVYPNSPLIPFFSADPYMLDPMQNLDRRAGKWHQYHQSAHDDALRNLPSHLGSTKVGIPLNQNIMDYNLKVPQENRWWTFSHNQQHQLAIGVLPPGHS